MSATEAKIATNEQPQPQPPKITVIFRIVSIPLISAFLESTDEQQHSYSPALNEGEGILEQGLQAYRTSPGEVGTPYHLCGQRRQQGG